jgi:hypothetical protein
VTSYGNFSVGLNNHNTSFAMLDSHIYVGTSLALAIEVEASHDLAQHKNSRRSLGPFDCLSPYVAMRLGWATETLPDLPLPDHFKELFYLWAHQQVDFVSGVPEIVSKEKRS